MPASAGPSSSRRHGPRAADAPFSFVVVSSPEYLRRQRAGGACDDLRQHAACASRRFERVDRALVFVNGNKPVEGDVSAP